MSAQPAPNSRLVVSAQGDGSLGPTGTVYATRPHETPNERAHRRSGEARAALDNLGHDHDRVFAQLEQAQADCLAAGSRWEPILQPSVEAAYAAWRHGPDTTLAIRVVGEAPV